MPGDRLAALLAQDLDRHFPTLVRDHEARLYAVARRLTRSRADAEDVAQEAFVRAYRALRTYDADRRRALRIAPWLAAIALNVVRNDARTRSRRPATAPLERDHGVTDGRLDAVGDDEALAALLAGLPEAQRHAVVLRHVQGLGYADVACALGRPVGTVKADVQRGMQALARRLEERP